jgi:hypothetical protein
VPVEAALTLLGFVVAIVAFLLTEGAAKAVVIMVFVCGVLASTSGIATGLRDVVTSLVTR